MNSQLLARTLDPASCLAPSQFIDSRDQRIESLSGLLTRGLDQRAQTVRLFRYVRDEVHYEFRAKFSPKEYVASYVLEKGRGFCVQKAVLLCALARAAQIPAALVISDLQDHTLPPKITAAMGTDTMFHHGLNAFYLEGRWLLADASLSPDVVTRKRFRPVDFDGKGDALHSTTRLDDTPHAQYVRFHGLYADLDYESMMSQFAAAYAHADPEALDALGYRM
jgi:transglutaminase-like putative cysteine protease